MTRSVSEFGLGNRLSRSEAASESEFDSGFSIGYRIGSRCRESASFAEFSNHQISQIPNHHHQAYHAKCVITFKGRWLWLILTL